jgi:hypothetical protein
MECKRTLSLIGLEKNNLEISRIGNYAFYELPNMSIMRFSHIKIGTISANAFDFNNNSTQTLYIDFWNCSLTEISQEEGVFSDAKRPIIIYFCMD